MANRKITFKEFWEKYPLHRGRVDAEKAWNRLSARDRHAAYNGVDRYREYVRQTGVAIKYPEGWIAGRRWEDEYEEDRPAAQPPAQTRRIEESGFDDMDSW